jgi:hypothetical protein
MSRHVFNSSYLCSRFPVCRWSIAASYAQATMARNVNGVLKFNVELPKSEMMQIFVKFAWRAIATGISHNCLCNCPIFIRWIRTSSMRLDEKCRLYHNIMPAMVNLQLRGIDVFRTFDIEETFCLLVLLVGKLESPSPHGITGAESGIKPPPRSKREREASPRTSFARMLRCVPGVSQDVAGRLVDRFKTLPALQRALAAETFPKVQLSHGQCLGKTRLKRLRCYLLEEQLEANAQP